MTMFRIVHQQTEQGPMYISDIEEGLPNRRFGEEVKQDPYVQYHQTYFTQVGNHQEVRKDKGFAGFVDLVPTDDVMDSVVNGDISEFRSKGLVQNHFYQRSDLNQATISNFKFDSSGSSSETYEEDITIDDAASGSAGDDYTVAITNANISQQLITVDDPDNSAEKSKAIADAFVTKIQNNSALDGEVTASSSGSASTATLTITAVGADPFSTSLSKTDTNGSISKSTVHTGRAIVEGSNFSSIAPFSTKVTFRDPNDNEEVTIDESTITSDGGLVDDTTIVVLQTTHGLGNAAGDLEEVDVQTQDPKDNVVTTDNSVTEV